MESKSNRVAGGAGLNQAVFLDCTSIPLTKPPRVVLNAPSLYLFFPRPHDEPSMTNWRFSNRPLIPLARCIFFVYLFTNEGWFSVIRVLDRACIDIDFDFLKQFWRIVVFINCYERSKFLLTSVFSRTIVLFAFTEVYRVGWIRQLSDASKLSHFRV